jgi:Rieske Fe-S protein
MWDTLMVRLSMSMIVRIGAAGLAVLCTVCLLAMPCSWAADDGQVWIATLGKVKELNEKEPTLVKAQFRDDDGILMDVEKVFVRWERTGKDSGRWVILSAICTYLKCLLEYDEEERLYRCPCYECVYDLEGELVEGPAKEDLPDYSDLAYVEDALLKLRRHPEED